MPSLVPYYFYQASSGAVFSVAVFMVFYQERVGLSLSTILWLQAYFVCVRALLDVPFGALADRYSRRLCLVASGISLSLGAGVILVWPSLPAAIVHETLLAAVTALRSGADTALLYDTMKAANALERYPQAESRSQAIVSLASGTFAVAGAFLAARNLTWMFMADVGAGLVSASAAALVPEPPLLTHRTRGHVGDAIRLARRTAGVRWTIALAVLVVSASHVYFFLQQPYLRAIGVPVALFGVVFAATKIVTAAVAASAHRIEGRLGVRGSAAVMVAMPTIGLGALAATTGPIGAVFILTRGVLDGLWMPLLNVLMHRLVPSDLRATLLSLQSFASRLALAAVVALCGVAAEHVGLARTLLAAAAGTAVVGALVLARAPRLPEHSRVIPGPA